MLRQLVLTTALGAALLSPVMAATPASIAPVNQYQTVAAGSAVALSARVLDASSQPVLSQLVTFSATAGTFPSPSVYTGVDGVATAYFMAPSYTGTFYAYATVYGYSFQATFIITVTAASTTTPGSITAINPNQTVAAGSSVTLSVRVLNASGGAVAYQLVSFSANAGSFSNPTVYTDANGTASAVYIAPTTTGTYYAYANVSGFTMQATFYITVGTGTTPGTGTGTGMQIYSGNGQVVTAFSPTAPRPLTVVVRDANGNPLPSVYVSWTVTSGIASLSTNYGYTDANGLATTTVSGSGSYTYTGVAYQQTTISAYSSSGTVYFTLTSLGVVSAGGGLTPISGFATILTPSSGTKLTGRASETLAGAIRAQVFTSTGVPLPYVGLDATVSDLSGPSASCAGSPLSDANGVVQCDLVMGRVVGEGTLTVNVGSLTSQTYEFAVTAGDPASATVVSGDGQSGRPGETLSQALMAEFKDAGGMLIQGLPVLWEFGAEGTGARLTNVLSSTDSSGRASANITLGTRPGDFVVRVRAANKTSVVATFNLKVVLPVAGLVKVSGDNQTAITSQAFAAPLVVEVRDAQARPVAGVTVTFAVTGGSATLGSATAVAGSDGRASTTVQAGAAAGAITVSASVDSQSVSFSLTSRLPGPVLTASSFVNGASFRPGLVPGSITAIVGQGLAPGVKGCAGPGTVVGPLPTTVADVQVQFGSTLAPILAVCNVSGQEQVVVQAPWDMAAGFTTMVKVTVGGGSTVVSSVPVLAALPGIFETTESGLRMAVALGSDGRLITVGQRARKGEIVYIYATGLGTVLPLASTNVPGLHQKPWYSVVAGIAARGVRVVLAEYAEGLIGVYVIGVEVPTDAPSGIDVPLALGVVTAEGQAPTFAADSKLPIQ